jgi:hypothetical protein
MDVVLFLFKRRLFLYPWFCDFRQDDVDDGEVGEELPAEMVMCDDDGYLSPGEESGSEFPVLPDLPQLLYCKEPECPAVVGVCRCSWFYLTASDPFGTCPSVPDMVAFSKSSLYMVCKDHSKDCLGTEPVAIHDPRQTCVFCVPGLVGEIVRLVLAHGSKSLLGEVMKHHLVGGIVGAAIRDLNACSEMRTFLAVLRDMASCNVRTELVGRVEDLSRAVPARVSLFWKRSKKEHSLAAAKTPVHILWVQEGGNGFYYSTEPRAFLCLAAYESPGQARSAIQMHLTLLGERCQVYDVVPSERRHAIVPCGSMLHTLKGWWC